MITIRTAEELARALSSPLDAIPHDRLVAHREHLLDYTDFAFEDLGLFMIVQLGDTLDAIETASPVRLVRNSQFALLLEYVEQHGTWLEALFILSDDGFGLVLFVQLAEAMDPSLLKACKALLPSLVLPAAR